MAKRGARKVEPPQRLAYFAEDTSPPQLANVVSVGGGASTLEITFAYAPESKVTAAMSGRAVPGVKRVGSRAEITTTPIARVALPINVAFELVAEIMTTVAGGVDALQGEINDIAQQMQTIFSSAETAETEPDE